MQRMVAVGNQYELRQKLENQLNIRLWGIRLTDSGTPKLCAELATTFEVKTITVSNGCNYCAGRYRCRTHSTQIH